MMGMLCLGGLGSTGRLGHGDERKYKNPTLVQSLQKQGVRSRAPHITHALPRLIFRFRLRPGA